MLTPILGSFLRIPLKRQQHAVGSSGNLAADLCAMATYPSIYIQPESEYTHYAASGELE
jgi:hypothetical protein